MNDFRTAWQIDSTECAKLALVMKAEELARLLAKQDKAGPRSELDALDDRELELFSLLGQGYSAAQIVSEFGFARSELDALRKGIRSKLHLKNNAQLLRLARQHATPD